MKRRQAIKSLAAISISASLLPACSFESGPVYENVPLERGQRTLIDLLTNAILPREGTEIQTPESTTDFILTMLNDCTAPEDIQKYLDGMKAFQEKIKLDYNTSFKRLDATEQLALFNQLQTDATLSEPIKHFFDTTLGMTRRHFTSSAHYMQHYLDFEFAPGRYIGCSAI